MKNSTKIITLEHKVSKRGINYYGGVVDVAVDLKLGYKVSIFKNSKTGLYDLFYFDSSIKDVTPSDEKKVKNYALDIKGAGHE